MNCCPNKRKHPEIPNITHFQEYLELTGGFENVDTDLFDMCPDANGIYKKKYTFILFWVFFSSVVIGI